MLDVCEEDHLFLACYYNYHSNCKSVTFCDYGCETYCTCWCHDDWDYWGYDE